MPVSTTDLNSTYKTAVCEYLQIEDYKIDYFANIDPSEIWHEDEVFRSFLGGTTVKTRAMRPPVIRWKQKGVWHSALIPVQILRSSWSDLFSSGEDVGCDWDKMEEEAVKIIKGEEPNEK